MTQTTMTAGKRFLLTAAAAFAACILTMSCATPAFAKEDPGWNTDGYVTGDSEGDRGSENNDGRSEEEGSDRNTTEPGFTTPGNGSLGDQIKSSNGKDFYTVRTKNNNTFYLVIDHTNSTENVYMLSLIDEDDLAEFLKEGPDASKTQAPAPVVIPETKPQAETAEKEDSQTQQPAPRTPFQNLSFWLLAALLGSGAAFYYFKVYKPSREEETEDSEGMETEDFPTETEGET